MNALKMLVSSKSMQKPRRFLNFFYRFRAQGSEPCVVEPAPPLDAPLVGAWGSRKWRGLWRGARLPPGEPSEADALGAEVSVCVVSPQVPWEDLRYLFGEIMYGGHITDDWDRRLCRVYLEEFMNPSLVRHI